jgi:hypothetical protein
VIEKNLGIFVKIPPNNYIISKPHKRYRMGLFPLGTNIVVIFVPETIPVV